MPDIIPPMNLPPEATPWGRAIQNLVAEFQRQIVRLGQEGNNASAIATSSTKVLTQNVISLAALTSGLQAQIDALTSAAINTTAVTASGLVSAGSLTVSGNATVSGATSLGGTLGVTGATTLSGGISGSVNIGTNVVAPNGTLVSTYARNHQVVTGYVSAWLDSSGNLLATASARKFKRDIEPLGERPWRKILAVTYRLRSAWILADIRGDDPSTVAREIGVIADDLLADFPELVVVDENGKPWSFHYERLAVVALQAAQEIANECDALSARVAALESRTA